MLGKHSTDKKWTLEEGLEEEQEMETGKKHMTEDYIVKIGTIRPCHKCGKPVDIVTYSGYEMDWMSITSCDEHEEENPIKPPFNKCHDKSCKVHEFFDEEEYYNSSLKIAKTINEVKTLLNTVKPESDSIMEYDRMCDLYGHSHPHSKPIDYEFWLYQEFIRYMGLNGKLRIRNDLSKM